LCIGLFGYAFTLLKLHNTEYFDDDNIGILWDEVTKAYRKALFHNLTGSTEENHKEYQDIKTAASWVVTLGSLVDTNVLE
jgi:hypothetical protein